MFDEEQIDARVDLILTQPDVRLRMGIARRAELPMSEVYDRWSDDDLLWDVAWDKMLADDARHRCQNCGVDPREQLAPDGRSLAKNFMWRLEVDRCDFCDEADEIRHRLTKGSERFEPGPPRVRYVPRKGDEKFLPDEHTGLILPRGASSTSGQ